MLSLCLQGASGLAGGYRHAQEQIRQCISNAKIKMCIMNIISRGRGEYLGGRVEWLNEVVQRW